VGRRAVAAMDSEGDPGCSIEKIACSLKRAYLGMARRALSTVQISPAHEVGTQSLRVRWGKSWKGRETSSTIVVRILDRADAHMRARVLSARECRDQVASSV
jgi:hypothetical protein